LSWQPKPIGESDLDSLRNFQKYRDNFLRVLPLARDVRSSLPSGRLVLDAMGTPIVGCQIVLKLGVAELIDRADGAQ